MKNKTTINRVYKEKNFVQLDNGLMQNRNLSFAAKGLLGMVLSLPTDWVIYMEWIHEQFPEGEDRVRTIVNELRANGYARFTQLRDEKGRICGASWDFSEEPVYEPVVAVKKPKRGNPVLDNPALQTQSRQTQKNNSRSKVARYKTAYKARLDDGTVITAWTPISVSEKEKRELDWTPITGSVDTETGEVLESEVGEPSHPEQSLSVFSNKSSGTEFSEGESEPSHLSDTNSRLQPVLREKSGSVIPNPHSQTTPTQIRLKSIDDMLYGRRRAA